MPSLPASDGFQNPVQSSGLNSKICNPENQLLDRSVSAPASICSSESSCTEPIDPRAIKSFESPTESQITPEKEYSLLLQHLSNNASLANNNPSPQTGGESNPACLLQKTLKETFIADSLKECNTEELDYGEQKKQAESKSVPDLNSETFSMEVESLKSASSLGDPLSTSGSPQSNSTSEVPAKYELSNLAAEDSSSPSRIHGLDTDPGRPSEEPCFSLASALKELHKLLVISQRGGSGCAGLASGASPPPAFPVADVDRILSAGFTPREALEALEQADGNTDLALLILLAKGIVVPT
ncbi:PREDICTED: regulatory solute carrier protein family 1 member 1 [Chaetura pelagica]|uniref:regulatory solute carrier protein family 1 member 1 n=1 Tax=Chaetura pelagica TaxID=8897 RepID=UPI000523BFEC|nr:PREDICTED: regulatory solute carrier protein family 1 member 1 [Chaetura pelagica]